MEISTRINFMDFETVGTVALVPRGLCGLSEMYFFYFAFILSLARFVLGGTRQCLGLRSSRPKRSARFTPGKSRYRLLLCRVDLEDEKDPCRLYHSESLGG